MIISTFIMSTGVVWSYPKDGLEGQVEEIRRNMVTREEFKLFVQMMNKRFEDMQRYMDRRFEDLQRYMDKRFEDLQRYMDKRFEDMMRSFEDLQRFFSIGIGILGLIQGILIAIITFFGLRILRRLEEIEKRVGIFELKEDIIRDIKEDIIRDLRERILQDVRKIVDEMIKEARAG